MARQTRSAQRTADADPLTRLEVHRQLLERQIGCIWISQRNFVESDGAVDDLPVCRLLVMLFGRKFFGCDECHLVNSFDADAADLKLELCGHLS